MFADDWIETKYNVEGVCKGCRGFRIEEEQTQELNVRIQETGYLALG